MCSIDVGQPAVCRGIDRLSLISSHSLLVENRNDELRQISDRGAPAWSWDNPPSLPPTGVFTPGGETPQGSSPLMFCHVLINAHISSFLVCFNDKHVPCGNLVTFSKYCWCICFHLTLPPPSLSPSCLTAAITPVFWHEEIVSYRAGAHTRHFPPEIQKKNRLDEGKASDKMSMCWDAVCFVDKAITYHPAWDSKKPLSISGAVYALYTYLTPCHLQMSPSGVYHGEVHPLIQTLSKLKILRTSAALHSLHEEGILWSKTMLKMYSFLVP